MESVNYFFFNTRISPNPNSFYECDVCQYKYQMQQVAIGEKRTCCPPLFKFLLLLTIDIGLILLIWQAMVFLNVGFIYLIDYNRSRDKLEIFQGWPKFGIDYFSGLTFFFFFLGCLSIFIGMIKLFLSCVGDSNKGCCEDGSSYRYDTYSYRTSRWDAWDWFFLWYWWSIWTPYRPIYIGPYQPVTPCYCYCDPIICAPNNCNFGGGGLNCNGGSGNNDGASIIIVILIVIFIAIVLIGVIVGMIMFFKIIYEITLNRISILQKKELIIENVVMEYQGQ